MEALRAYDDSVHPVGERLPESTRVYRVNVVTAMLNAGVPIHKIDCFRSLLEEHAFSQLPSLPFEMVSALAPCFRNLFTKMNGNIVMFNPVSIF